jgi:hypothetical protein
MNDSAMGCEAGYWSVLEKLDDLVCGDLYSKSFASILKSSSLPPDCDNSERFQTAEYTGKCQ